ncbi:MAG TPA: hypothetical protein VKU19_22960 [Bryobacteraceae bacterium]|nr:hypothetical protein [Bryobacteraceae bacterium]
MQPTISIVTTPIPVNVQRATPTLQIDSPPATFVCGSPTTFTADLAFPPTLGLINRNVSLMLPPTIGQLVNPATTLLAQGTLALSTVAAGRATASLSATLPKNTSSVLLSFAGDTLLNGVNSAPVPIHVQPLPVIVQLTATPQGGGV